MQTKILCTATRAKKVVLCLLLGSTTVQIASYLAGTSIIVYRIQESIICVVVSVTVLVINLIVVREIRRASHDASANLGRQQHQQHQQSAVPTVLLVTTSLVYVLLIGVAYFLREITWWIRSSTLVYSRDVASILSFLVFAYNFYVYLITGQQFRSELHKLFC